MELTLTSEERELLIQIVQERHREFLREIARTDHHDFKQALRRKEQLLVSVLEKLEAKVTVAA